MQGFKGDQNVDDSVWTVKTHNPYDRWSNQLFVTKGFFLSRNPFDSIVSLFNMMFAFNHSKSLKNKINEEFPEAWQTAIERWTKLFGDVHRYWVEKSKVMPIAFYRFEDLVSD